MISDLQRSITAVPSLAASDNIPVGSPVPPRRQPCHPPPSGAVLGSGQGGGDLLRSFAIANGRLEPLADGGGVPPEAAWVDMMSPTSAEERLVESALGLDIPTRAEAGGLQVSDRLVSTAGALYMSALVPAGQNAERPTVPITFVRTGDRLVTVRYSSVGSLDPFVARYTRGEASLAGAGDLLAGLLEVAVDRIDERLQQIGGALDHLSRGIFHHPTHLRQQAGRPLPLGRRIRRLEAVIEDLGTQHELAGKLRESIQSLIRLTAFSREHAEDGLRQRLDAVSTDLHSVAEHATALSADMEFMLDATVGLIDTQQNKVIYLLSIMGIVMTPPVLVASVYGMNFRDMPELAWTYGYGWALGLMLLSAVGPILLFKLRGWL